MALKHKSVSAKISLSSRAAERRGEAMVLQLFAETARNVPAYKHFLRTHKINPAKIQTIADFRQVPPVDKKNYLSQYSLAELSWGGNLFNSRIISVSSGSTGTPFFWPRGRDQDEEGTWMHERLYREIFEINRYSSLVVICFSMGTWIAGSFTAASTLGVADLGYKLNLVTPGIERDEAVKVIKSLAGNYQQVILAGYPPFIKDVIEEGTRQGVTWSRHRTRLLLAGEAFSEEWRDYVLKLAGERDPYRHCVNIYGTADAAMLGHETPVSIALRRVYNRRDGLRQERFDSPVMPSLMQYHPDRRYFETIGGEIVFSARAGIPLVRYNIHDTGGVMSAEELIEPVAEQFAKKVEQHEISVRPWQLPFVYLNGRKDFTATIYAVNIYPENIKAALIDPQLHEWVTGKFTMATKYHSNMEQYLEINVELAKGEAANAVRRRVAKDVIVETLRRFNAEYHKLYASVGTKAVPQVHLIEHGDGARFGNGVKHRWVERG